MWGWGPGEGTLRLLYSRWHLRDPFREEDAQVGVHAHQWDVPHPSSVLTRLGLD